MPHSPTGDERAAIVYCAARHIFSQKSAFGGRKAADFLAKIVFAKLAI
jgi:hypothetical protein